MLKPFCAAVLLSLCSSSTPLRGEERVLASCDVVVVADRVIGCRGAWTRNPQCPSGWKPCEALPAGAVGACQADLGGFFAANVTLGRSTSGLTCRFPPTSSQYGLAGCGTKPFLGKAELLPALCQGFPLAVACTPRTGYMCGVLGLPASANQFARNGVLCCR